jgi:hypothetical protein
MKGEVDEAITRQAGGDKIKYRAAKLPDNFF